MLEIVEGEEIGGCGCAQAYACFTARCMRWVLVSIGWSGGIKAAIDRLPMPPDRPRY